MDEINYDEKAGLERPEQEAADGSAALEIVYAVEHPRAAFPGETWRASYGARHEAPADPAAFATQLADETRTSHSYSGPLTVSLWAPREDEHYGLPVPDDATVFHFPAI
ncbi:hypothetical protein ACEZCY_14060 [Streptacidiphilus sp. N1-12]|uniref:Uncharacterized protein n=2 Tax=Streptacidiphilus alkalitolerans TaxID=3342712 RepID=A0ABV6WE83_9ACTN